MSTVRLTTAQVRILQTLARNASGLTRGAIQKKLGSPVMLAGPLGPTEESRFSEFDERHGYPSLHSLGFVTVEIRAGKGNRTDTVFILTDEGVEASRTYATKKRPKEENRIDRELLTEVALKWKPLRTYTFEEYTEEDLRGVRADLNGEADDIPLNDLRRQLTNLRKIGALAEEKGPEWPEWYEDYRDGPHFGRVEEQTAKRWGMACTLNPAHTEDLAVVHRCFDHLGEEGPLDTLVLCSVCRKRGRLSLPSVPTEMPDSLDTDE